MLKSKQYIKDKTGKELSDTEIIEFLKVINQELISMAPKKPRKALQKWDKGSLEMDAAEYLSEKINEWQPGAKISEAKLQLWASDADKMFRIDKRNPDDFARLLEWISAHQSGDFSWRNVIRSMAKLRVKWNEGKFIGFIAKEHLNAK